MRCWYNIVPADGPGHDKGTKFQADHAAIMEAKESQTVVVLEKKWSPEGKYDENLQDTNGQETLRAHLATMSRRTGLAALDDGDKPLVWQTN